MSSQSEKGTEMVHHGVEVPQKAVAEFCRRHHVRRLALFGSVLRDDFRPDSDVDVLVEFEPGCVPGLLRMAGLEAEMRKLGTDCEFLLPAVFSKEESHGQALRNVRTLYVMYFNSRTHFSGHVWQGRGQPKAVVCP